VRARRKEDVNHVVAKGVMRRALTLSVLSLLAAASLAVPPALASGNEAKKAEAPSTYFALQPLTATAIRRDGRRGVMIVEAGVEAPDPKLMERARQSEPRLRAAFAQVLMTYTAGLPRGAAPNLDYLGGQMQDAADKVLGRKGSKVLLGSAMVN
jgi:flagellar basal body-associated protein FliL